MASSLLALIDDIASVLDDIATLTKVATGKTSGVLGDDLALNAQQVTGVRADRELPVVWAVAKGSFRNKAVLVPAALLISAFAPWAVTPLLMIGGAFLCFEGLEKLAHRFLHSKAEDTAHNRELAQALTQPVDMATLENDKIKGAIRTDFVLSAEIIAITLGTVAAAPLLTQVSVLTGIAVIMTVGVYGLVAGIVKLDDAGLHLSRKPAARVLGRAQRGLGRGILLAAPWLMKGLSIAGTAAMFLVGGGILVHGVPAVHHLVEALAHRAAAALPGIGDAVGTLAPAAMNGVAGVIAGALVFVVVQGVKRVLRPAGAAGHGIDP